MTDRSKMAELYMDSELLILAVEKYPCLFNVEHDDYKDRNKKVTAWLAVGEKVLGDERWSQLTDDDRHKVGKEVQKRWRHLRDAFVKSIKSHDERPTNGPKWKKKYVFYKQMLFLLPVLQNRRSANNTDETESDSALFKFSDAPQEEDEREQRLIISQCTGSEIIPANPTIETTPVAVPPFKRKKKSSKQFGSKLLKILDKNITKPTDSNNPDKLFLLSMLPTIALIPEENKLKFKIEILQVAQKYASMCERKELPLSFTTPPYSSSSFNDSNQQNPSMTSRGISPALVESDNTSSSVSSQSCSQLPSEQSDDSIISLFS